MSAVHSSPLLDVHRILNILNFSAQAGLLERRDASLWMRPKSVEESSLILASQRVAAQQYLSVVQKRVSKEVS